MKLNKNKFLKKFKIPLNDYRKTGLSWKDLVEIYKDYKRKKSDLEPYGNFIVEFLRKINEVHSIKMRLKNPEHLIEKIIRKKLENNKLNINLKNYREIITDLIGIRALHLFKEDWVFIHEFILKKWKLKNKPIANIRAGDPDEIINQFLEKDCEIYEHPYGYRSIHYIIIWNSSNEKIFAEIQVRTIFEEGWSEIDHHIRYPYDIQDPILSQYLVIFNRLSGNADEMGSYIKYLKIELESRALNFKKELEEKINIMEKLQERINELKIESKEKIYLRNKLKTLDSKFPKHIEKKSYKKLEKRKKDFYESFRFDNLNKKLYLFSPDLHSLRKKIVKEKNEEIKLNSDTNKEKINYFILKATKEKGELGLHKKNEWKTSNTLGDSKEMNNGDILIIYFVSRASKDNRLKFKEVYQIKNKKVQKNNLIFKVKKIGEFKKPVTYNEFQKDNTISKVIKHKFSKAGQKINNIKINYELYTYLIEILGKGLI